MPSDLKNIHKILFEAADTLIFSKNISRMNFATFKFSNDNKKFYYQSGYQKIITFSGILCYRQNL